jgi:DNA-binding transcriptional LysR family regulator
MDIQDLAAFVEVADNGSFSRAAQRLHLTQPAVSKRVAALEERVGHLLFDRVARNVTLTDAGRTLLPYARNTLQGLEDGRRALSHLSDRVAGKLSLGISHHIGLHHLPPVLKHYTLQYPDVELDIHFMDSEIACHDVLAGKLELGIVTLPTEPVPHLDTRVIWPDPLAAVVAPDHPLAREASATLQDLAEYEAVLPDETTYTHRIIRAGLQRYGLSPRVRLATNYLETLKMLVAIGLGWSVLPASMVDDTLRRLDVSDLKLHRNLGVVWHERRTLSAAAQALMRNLQRQI